MTFFLTYRCMLSTASLVLAVFLWRHEPCCLLTDEEGVLRFPARADYRLGTYLLGGLHLGFRFPSNRSPYLFESRSESCHTCTRLPARPLPIQRDFWPLRAFF